MKIRIAKELHIKADYMSFLCFIASGCGIVAGIVLIPNPSCGFAFTVAIFLLIYGLQEIEVIRGKDK